MRVLITGGAGFIGSTYARMIAKDELEGISSVTILDKLTYAGNMENLDGCLADSRFEFIHGDICDKATIDALINRHDVVINFAAESHVDRSINSSEPFITTNIAGTAVILDAIRNNPSTRLVHIGTDEVYGSIDIGSWDENFPLAPNSPYSASKASADLLCMAFQRTFNLDICITRCSNNYGPYQFPEKLIPLFITNLIEGKQVPLYGDGTNIREWIYVEDHCRAIHLVVLNGRKGEIYNIGSTEEHTNVEIANLLLRNFDVGPERIKFVEDRLGHDQRYAINSTKIRNTLGFRESVDFTTGIDLTVAWYKNNQNWWKPLKV